GVAEFCNGSFQYWGNTLTIKKVAAAHTYLLSFIKQKGPLDIFLGFSKGAAPAASILLHHEIEHPELSPFKATIFICSSLPFSRSVHWDYLIADKYFLRDDDDLSSSSGSEPESDASGSNSESERVTVKCKDGPYYHMFHADVDEIRISVPTAHVYGTKDPWRKHSIDLVELCHRAQRLQFQHDGGHEIPRE
ncbi:hypothetical protein M501DRAFT_919338, partial [Patellaria atrata CBS 101060]